MSYLQENLSEILRYFHIRNNEENRVIIQRNLFSDFLKISSFLVNLVNKNKLYEDA
jgi:hypothetical protein